MSDRILWIDDQIENYSEFVDGLANRGIAVTASSTVEGAVNILRDGNFDLILLDLRMPGKNGFDFLRDHLSKTQVPVCVLSSYLHLEEYHRQLNRLRSNVAVLDKDLPQPDSEAFGVFADKLRRLIKTPPTSAPRAFEKAMEEKLSDIDPFDISFRHYLNLPNRLKQLLRARAKLILADKLDREFQSGSNWLLFCGDADAPRLQRSYGESLPDNDKILQTAIELDRVPYQFSSPDGIDDFHSGHCFGPNTLKGYPTLTIKLGSRELNIHFDTGSPFTFMSYEDLLELNLVDRNAFTIDGARGHRSYEYVSQRLRAKIIDQKRKGSRVVSLNVKAIKNWDSCPLVVYCPRTCSHSDGSVDNVCHNRHGLIGRDIVYDNSISITVCGATNRSTYSVVRTVPGKGDRA